jgi:UDP-glucose-4-epimerase GalE
METKRTALITGGTGYLGSHLAKALKKDGWYVISLDLKSTLSDLESKLNRYVNHFITGDVCDTELLDSLFTHIPIDVVFHLAGRIEVAESEKHPTVFWKNNVAGTINLLDVMKKHGVENIVYSSSAAVYFPSDDKLDELSILTMNNSVYGTTKLVAESAITDSKLNHIIFRYFNLAGADMEGEMGEDHEPETHLIPRILQNLNNIQIYGDNYNTEDGTCIRDYIHVADVADAHVLAGNHLLKTKSSDILNLGTGQGYSVLQIVNLIKDCLKKEVHFSIQPRRTGDPDRLVADATLAGKVLTFTPKYDIIDIIKSANFWYEKRGKQNG